MEELRDWRTPNGRPIRLYIREGDTSDHAVVDGIMDGEYGKPLGLNGIAVDVGAHIGSWAIATAIDNPNMAVVAIEAVYENVLMAQRNVRLNDLEQRVSVLYRAASSSNHDVRIKYGYRGSEFASTNRYIGDLLRPGNEVPGVNHYEIQTVQGIRLSRLFRILKEDVRLMKIDCEGCEWQFLKSPHVRRVHEIVGEFHGPEADLEGLLATTHEIQRPNSMSDLGMFRATLRAK